MRNFGLIGKRLSHSFSKKFFENKFKFNKIKNADYQLFEIENSEDLPKWIQTHKSLCGFNITIPYKQEIIKYLDAIDPIAAGLNSVNCVKISNGKLHGYNTDTFGFDATLRPLVNSEMKALIFGSGGASKSIVHVLKCLNIKYEIISSSNANYKSYAQLIEADYKNHQLWINTTPVGMYPNTEDILNVRTSLIRSNHVIYDLIYNPPLTRLLKKAKEQQATIINGLQMLEIQAEKSWEIWNNTCP